MHLKWSRFRQLAGLTTVNIFAPRDADTIGGVELLLRKSLSAKWAMRLWLIAAVAVFVGLGFSVAQADKAKEKAIAPHEADSLPRDHLNRHTEHVPCSGRDALELIHSMDSIDFKTLRYQGDPTLTGGRFKPLPLGYASALPKSPPTGETSSGSLDTLYDKVIADSDAAANAPGELTATDQAESPMNQCELKAGQSYCEITINKD